MIFGILFGLLWPVALALFWYLIDRLWHPHLFGRRIFRGFMTEWIWQAAGLVVVWAIFRLWPYSAGAGASLAAAIAVRWWKSGKRRRAEQLLGAKTRALRDALVRRARETAIPRPVLAPGGASW